MENILLRNLVFLDYGNVTEVHMSLALEVHAVPQSHPLVLLQLLLLPPISLQNRSCGVSGITINQQEQREKRGQFVNRD
jgi:hypothetical protein